MFVSKTRLGKKMLKRIEEYKEQGYHYCSICRKAITELDIKNLNFEYVKNRLAENYAHTSCIEYKRRTHKNGKHSQ